MEGEEDGINNTAPVILVHGVFGECGAHDVHSFSLSVEVQSRCYCCNYEYFATSAAVGFIFLEMGQRGGELCG